MFILITLRIILGVSSIWLLGYAFGSEVTTKKYSKYQLTVSLLIWFTCVILLVLIEFMNLIL